MSHVSVCRTKIVNPNPEILSHTLNAVAQMLGLQVADCKEVKDAYVYITGDIILYDPQFGRYFGVRCRESLEFEYDSYGWKTRVQEIKRKIIQTYVHFAVIQQLQTMGYKVSNVQELEGKIVCEVVKA